MGIDRAACPTIQANDARDLTRSGRVALNPLGGAPGTVYAVEVDGQVAGVVLLQDTGWVAARPGWRDPTPRPKRHAAVRRLIMSHPVASFGSPTHPGGTPRD